MALLTDTVKPPIPEKPSIKAAMKTKTHPTDAGSVPETRGKSSQPSSLFPLPGKKSDRKLFSSKSSYFFHTQIAGTGTNMPASLESYKT